MKAQITITGDGGIVYTGEAELFASATRASTRRTRPERPKARAEPVEDINFDLPARPFMKKYSHLMTGPKRLTLLIAHIAKGDTKCQVSRAEVSKSWNKMTALMGGGQFNSAYGTRATDNGWIGSPKPGIYTLLPTGREVLEK